MIRFVSFHCKMLEILYIEKLYPGKVRSTHLTMFPEWFSILLRNKVDHRDVIVYIIGYIQRFDGNAYINQRV